MLTINRFKNGLFRTELSEDLIQVEFVRTLLTESMLSFSFLIERGSEICGSQFADLINEYSAHERANYIANALRVMNEKEPKAVIRAGGEITFIGFNPEFKRELSATDQRGKIISCVPNNSITSKDTFNKRLAA